MLSSKLSVENVEINGSYQQDFNKETMWETLVSLGFYFHISLQVLYSKSNLLVNWRNRDDTDHVRIVFEIYWKFPTHPSRTLRNLIKTSKC